MTDINEIQKEVSQWSALMFGRQETPYVELVGAPPNCYKGMPRDTQPPKRGHGVRAALDKLAPLLGVVEELGEAAAADNSKDLADAVGDMAIYLCDYCGRSRLALGDLVLDGAVPGLGVDKPLVPTDDGNLDPFAGVVAYVGALCHVELKRCQNIRGYHDDTFYRAQRVAALYGLVYYLQRFSKDNLGVGVYDVLKQTWENVVSKRNWREAQQAEKTAATE